MVSGSGRPIEISTKNSFVDRALMHTKRYQRLPLKNLLSTAVNRRVAGSNPARGAMQNSLI